MALTYKIENDALSKWVKLITINSDSEINIWSTSFKLTIIDIFQYFNGEYLNSEDTFQFEEYLKEILKEDSTYCKFNVDGRTVGSYVNNDISFLISNGIQLWLEGDKCLKIRVTCNINILIRFSYIRPP